MLNPIRLLRRLRALLTTRRLDDELDEEMRFHLEMETAKRMRLGMDEPLARESARRDFGGVSHHRDRARDARGVRPVEDFIQDLRVGVRSIAKQRTYAGVAILTLAIGIGGTTALWSAVYRVLLEPYPFKESERIVTLFQSDVKSPARRGLVAPANYVDVRTTARSFDMIGAAEPWSYDWIGPEGPEQFQVARVTRDFVAIQGLQPLLGRVFLREEFESGSENVVLLSESVWRVRFGADSSIVGRVLRLDTVPRVVIGVMPEVALAPYGAQVWAPKILTADEKVERASAYWTILGRLAPGVTLEQANAELSGIGTRLASDHPATNRNTGFSVVTLRDAVAGSVRRSLLMLFGAVGFVMLIACVNVANLQIAETVRRQRELAIRTAIGAGRGRIVRQLMTESLLIAVIGAAAGLAVAYAGIAVIRTFAPFDLWQLAHLRLDAPAILFAMALALVASLLVGTMPVAAASRIQLAQSLAAGGRFGSSGIARRRANRILVVSEIALALVLLVGTGLLLRSLSLLAQTDRGFRTEGVLVATVQAWSYYPTPTQRAAFVQQAVERLMAIPGIEKVGMTSSLPLSWPIGFDRSRLRVEGRPTPPGDELPTVRAAATSPGYFDVLSIPLLAGRAIAETDLAGSPPIVVINRALARRYFPDENPLGKRVAFGFMTAPETREIVGIVGDVRHEGLHADPEPTVFVPHAQAATGAIHFLARSTTDPALLQRSVRATLAQLNGSMPLSDVKTMDSVLAGTLRQRRFQLGLLSAFSLTALLLSAIGIYGVMSRATSERTHEIGVRMAVGAHASDVRWMVLRNGGALAAGGIVAGVAMALVLTRYMTGMLFGVTPLDPITYLGAAVVLLVAAMLATWLPAWRASAVDPVVALRSD